MCAGLFWSSTSTLTFRRRSSPPSAPPRPLPPPLPSPPRPPRAAPIRSPPLPRSALLTPASPCWPLACFESEPRPPLGPPPPRPPQGPPLPLRRPPLPPCGPPMFFFLLFRPPPRNLSRPAPAQVRLDVRSPLLPSLHSIQIPEGTINGAGRGEIGDARHRQPAAPARTSRRISRAVYWSAGMVRSGISTTSPY